MKKVIFIRLSLSLGMGPESLKSQENKKSRRNEKLKVKTYQQVGVEILSQ